MSNIDEQIKFLQKQKSKIEFLNVIKGLIDQYNWIDEQVKLEIYAIMADFIDDQIVLIEQGDTTKSDNQVKSTTSNQFNDEEYEILKGLIAKVKGTVKPTTPIVKPKPVIDEALKAKKLEFANEYKDLAEQRVTVKNPTTQQEIEGLVIGVDYPNLILQLNNGAQIKVPPEHLI